MLSALTQTFLECPTPPPPDKPPTREPPARPSPEPRLSRSDCMSWHSGRKNVLRKLLRIPYCRLKAGFSVCWLCLFVAGVLSEMHEVRTFVPCKAFLFDMFAFFTSLENYFGFGTTNVKGKTDHSVSLRWNKRFWTFFKRLVFFFDCASN